MESPLLMIIQGVFLVLLGGLFRMLQGRLKDIDDKQAGHSEKVSVISVRLAVVETKQTRYDQDIDDIKALLKHIDEKIERL